ncbi:uncharacterized protein FFB20_09251 [Fusarium fujikuroi]|nr:uncharacterized protein FFC1_03688 [Fusarium fujikuroi]SCN92672.1 uncharacterized protein FFB20_09251 [Fusarium fujikuroi]SCO03033.1 uncharacterized protein FFE2_10159 [Fusarium fujikuroi]SCO08257.1 uncharacterized protein FFM5_09310 [Fusarium fujikuroi]SCO32886.1 uncharacterized protein FFNC_03143 [Fusarium fujikuroi]
MCCGRKDPTSKLSAIPPSLRTPNISSYTEDQELRQDRIIHNMGCANMGLSEEKQRAMAETFHDGIRTAKDRDEW